MIESIKHIFDISENLKFQYWASAFNGLLVRKRHLLYSILPIATDLIRTTSKLENVTDVNSLGILNVIINLPKDTKEKLVGLVNKTALQEHLNFTIPAKHFCGYITDIPSPSECRDILGLRYKNGGISIGDHSLTTLFESLMNFVFSKDDRQLVDHKTGKVYSRESVDQKILKSAVLPYIDCLDLNILLYILKDEIENKGISLELSLFRWNQMEELIMSSDIDIGYSTTGILNDHSSRFEFYEYTHDLRDDFEFIEKSKKNNLKSSLNVNIVGSIFGEEKNPEIPFGLEGAVISFSGEYCVIKAPIPQVDTYDGKSFKVLSTTDFPKDLGNDSMEQIFLIAAASGALGPNVYILPTIQGYVWAAEVGLLSSEINFGDNIVSFGSLKSIPVDTENITNKGKQTFFVRIPKNKNRETANEFKTHLKNAIKKLRKHIYENFIKGNDSCESIVSAIMAPVFVAEPSYSGVLNLFDPDLFLSMYLDDKFNFRPYTARWIIELNKMLNKKKTSNEMEILVHED